MSWHDFGTITSLVYFALRDFRSSQKREMSIVTIFRNFWSTSWSSEWTYFSDFSFISILRFGTIWAKDDDFGSFCAIPDRHRVVKWTDLTKNLLDVLDF